jgi:hypothetical protein
VRLSKGGRKGSSGFNALAIAVAKFEVFATWEYSKALVVYLFELPKLGVCAFCVKENRGGEL